MKTRIIAAAFAAVVSLPALANSGYTPAHGEISAVPHPATAPSSRADVRRELDAWQRNPVAANGWVNVGGEVGAVYVGDTNGYAQARAFGSLPAPRPAARTR